MPARFARHALLVAIAACAPAWAADTDVTTADISLGEHVSGPVIGPEGLTGRVVVLEFWGIQCPPCIRSMPELEKLHREFGLHGLAVIGAHAQGGTAEELRKSVAELGVTFTIVENASVNGGMDFGGIPHCMVFDHTGTCIFRGSPFDAQGVIATAAQAAPAAILAGRQLVKLAPLGQMLKDEAACGTALKKVRALIEAKDEDTAAEARFVVERLEAHGRRLLDEGRGLADSDPVAAAALVQRCAATFKGSDIGGDANKVLLEWKKDKAFVAALKAGQQLAKLEALQAAMAAASGNAPLQLKSQAREIARSIEKAAPGSSAAVKAAAIVATLDAGS